MIPLLTYWNRNTIAQILTGRSAKYSGKGLEYADRNITSSAALLTDMQVVKQAVVLEMERKERSMKRKKTVSAVGILVVLTVVVVFSSSQGTSQTTPPSSSAAQQNEIADMKKQIIALAQRVNTLEVRLEDLYKYKVTPLR